MNNLVEYIKSKCENLDDMFFRKMDINNNEVWVIFNDALVDSSLASNFVIRSIVEVLNNTDNKEERKNNSLKEKIEEKLNINQSKIHLENGIAINKVKKLDKEKDNVFKYILSGFVVIILDNEIYVMDARANLSRSISQPVNENSIRGAKDSFVENIMMNVGLIRNRIKTEDLV